MEVVDCDFMRFRWYWLFLFFFFFFKVLFLNHCRIYCTLGGIWQNLSATCGWIRRIYLAFLEFIEKKMENRVDEWIWQLGIWSIWRMNSQILPRFLSDALKKKMEIRGKNSIWKLRVLFVCSMNAQNLPLFSNIHWSNGKLGWMWLMGT